LTGFAAPRPYYGTGSADYVSFPFYGPWGYWYPWYTSGFGWGLGYMFYDPWAYGATSWYWGRYGMWYDPYSYSWDPGSYGGSYSSSSSGSKARETTGALRIKANVGDAKVYVDGALVGLAKEFSGLSGHLELEGGHHKLELRAEGYLNYARDIDVPIGKVKTIRMSLKKK
jgi:PEGA domain